MQNAIMAAASDAGELLSASDDKSYQAPKSWALNLHTTVMTGCETPWWVMNPRRWHSVESVPLCTLEVNVKLP